MKMAKSDKAIGNIARNMVRWIKRQILTEEEEAKLMEIAKEELGRWNRTKLM